MAEKEGNRLAKNFHLDTPHVNHAFHVKGADHAEWGMKDRLSRIFSPKTGRTVMLAFDHGYIMGPTAGLERLDLVIPALAPGIDVFMATRGALRTCVPPTFNKGIALRCTAGSSVLDDDMSHEVIGVDVEDAIRMNAACMAVQIFIGSSGEKTSIQNLCNTIDAGNRYGIPTLGVVAVGKDMERTTKFFLLATRMLAEFGAHIVKTYYCENFEQVVAACPVPIVVAGGKKLPEEEALTMTYRAIAEGAAGVDMGRNIFQAEDPLAMTQAVARIVHENYTDKEAYEFYRDTAKQSR
ncbi:3-hydroxy-5-phosphonooxypentane-2,4-dione thiolase [Ruminococcus sp. OA3]|uniref:3-hydroxy-5-phosphonooxypentane-2,4-dione thiolase n=1 Tax=Ruminococcus sp. OA3 TaxID=2914164 RepID=UPI001F05E684|nr:3-hydroxy-5-phosphonooxypentane-2,4-dione thiolase [Ruminococcus sp. OA3]MCH1981302.1 3-hydroxy-5-phosphonooxypentane-2,4-dione thiolase [Ruminococcus sp. OA3]